MKEEFLHFLWKHKLFLTKKIYTSQNEEIVVVKTGSHNKNSGPDFLNAHLKINGQAWVGNIEIHLKSSDWYLHYHEVNTTYDAVILHIVWEHDVEVYMKNDKALPTLELKNYVNNKLLANYRNLFSKELRWIPCERSMDKVDTFLIQNWLERLYFERLENKAVVIKGLLRETNNDYEAVLFQLLAKNFGLKVNGVAFFNLAKSIDYTIIRKLRFDSLALSALLFGQAGFLEEDYEEPYFFKLKKEYAYIKHKYNLKTLSGNQFSFFRMRPTNFPTVRIAQLIMLLHQHQNLFSQLMKYEKIVDFYKCLKVEVDTFWQKHYTFQTTSKTSLKRITESFIDLLLINTILPLRFVYFQETKQLDNETFVELIQQINSEKNSILKKFNTINIKAKNALESQALLELKNNYCNEKRCTECVIGTYLLRN
ncbi:conserved hypothetical protein [Tenacibaculum sp. 190524A02b]|uniref:DUF2851 family protein n=1 Tax=Tenacibaculum vairaonense TaxID=3137860 RepID=A0ABM9PK11_9FLAO